MLSILFGEDDATIAMRVEYSLKQDSFQVSLAYHLEEARDLLKRQPFNLALLDLGLPDGSSYTLCKEIRAGRGYLRPQPARHGDDLRDAGFPWSGVGCGRSCQGYRSGRGLSVMWISDT